MGRSSDPSAATSARPRRLLLRAKALIAFLAVAVVPVGVLVATTLRGYGRVVGENEQRMQLLVVRDVARDAERHLAALEADARAVAAAVALAGDGARGDEAVLDAVRAVIASRASLSGVRLEIPGAGVSLPFVKEGLDREALPASTAALRAAADADGVALGIEGDRSVLVVPVPGGKAAAYVTAPLWLGPLEADLAAAIERNGAGSASTRAVLVDPGRRVVATYPAGAPLLPARGDDASSLPVLQLLEAPSDGQTAVGAAGTFDLDGASWLGTIHVDRRWRVAIWRPEAIALAEYHAVRRRLAGGLAAAAAIAIVIALYGARAITRPVLDLAGRARVIGARRWSELRPLPARGDELGALGAAIERMATDLQSSEAQIAKEARLRGDLSRFLGTELVDAIVRGEHSLELGGERRVVSIVFADIVGFTPIAQNAKPEEVVSLLNELFTILSEVVFRHGGTVDKFVGDGLMAVFGAPIARDDHAERAVAAAEDMVRFTETASASWRERLGVDIQLGVGVSSGEVVVGNIGSSKRMEYTVVGAPVNVASRLETLAAAGQILVSASCAALVGDALPLEKVGEQPAPGGGTMPVYEVV